MTDMTTRNPFGVLIDPATLRIERLLPGPIERCWAYLTQGDLRRQWLAAGEMDLTVGAPFEFVWRNDELNDPPSNRLPGVPEEQRMHSRIVEVDPPHKISFSWEGSGDVTIELASQGKDVRLTLTHRRLPDRPSLLSVSAGWHMHLDILVARANGEAPAPFWEGWRALKQDYDGRLPV
jgi:uncharacterized protein YndB with AHSA1/START domain